MAKKNSNKKVLLGSALAGLILAGPGISVSTGDFFQTAELSLGYRVAQAEHEKGHEAKKADEGKKEGEQKKEEAKQDAKQDAAKKDEKKAGSGKCGAGACG